MLRLTSFKRYFTVRHILNPHGENTVKADKLILSLAMTGLLATGSAYSAQTTTTQNNAPQKIMLAQAQNTTAPQAASVVTSASDDQKAKVESIVHDYILSNPDVIVQALQAFQQKQMEKAKQTIADTEKKAPQYVDALFHHAADPAVGNPQAKVTIVEFFDYQCPHCVDMAEIMENLAATNPNVRVVYKEFPIRGPVSVFATKAALAAKNQGKYAEFHKALMHPKQQPLTNDSIMEAAKSVGLNVDQLKKDMNNPLIDQQIKDTYKLAQDLELIGTPAFFVGKTTLTNNTAKTTDIAFIPGQVDQNQLDDTIKKVSQ